MKKIIVCIVLLIISENSFCQQDSILPPNSSKDYLKLSRSQKTGAFILLGAGVTTLAIISKGNTSLDALPFYAIIGGISTVASIPLFIAAARNKRKALNSTVYFKFERMKSAEQAGIAYDIHPALSKD